MSFEITWINTSKIDWTRGNMKYTESPFTDTLSQTPSKILQAIDGQTAMSISENVIKDLSNPKIHMGCCFYDKKSNQQFGMRLLRPVQVFDIGHSPYWYASHGTAESTPDWIKHESDASEPYTYPLAKFSVIATPKITHTSISVTIIIKDS